MNKTKVILTMFIMSLSLCETKAQDMAITKGNFLIDFGYSAPNVAQSLFSTIGDGTNNGYSSPWYFKLGYAFLDRNVFGIYMNISSGSTGNINWTDSTYTQDQFGNWYLNTTPESYYYTMTLFTLGIDYTHHFGNNPQFSPYYGVMIGYTDVTVTTHGTVPIDNVITSSGSFTAYQLYLGATWYFVKGLGIDGRISYGNNYYASIGLSCKFGGRKGDVSQKQYSENNAPKPVNNSNNNTQMVDVVYLKNGSVIHGTIIEQVPNESIKIQTKDGNIFVYRMDEIMKITKEPSK